ncbi:hypothetical protein M7I_1124 [Glarea lozoyensis 74030]|uniref:Uncharacterized protein n=1 Tax=Glarea lozoyensis (strain ATCC 74030 / MF5533) TaxID=1104152 RepID=H0EF85_GLAL7|nr:hypothetical protein M7I_1124 [Glarea lozoyensis 74030]
MFTQGRKILLTSSGQHLINHPPNPPQIIPLLTQPPKFLLPKAPPNLPILPQHLKQTPSPLNSPLASLINHIMRPPPPKFRRQPHHNRLPHNQPPTTLQIPPHNILMHDQTAQHKISLMQRADREHEGARDGMPF